MAADDAVGATRHDDETLDYVKVAVGREHGLSEGQARRLRGATLSALRDDAKQMRDELGLEPLDDHGDRQRDATGRFQTRSMNAAIRAAAGR